jgi:hypothetical protein
MALIGNIQYLKIHPTSISIRKENLYDTPKSTHNKKSISNLERNLHHNKMSKQSTTKCKRAINYLLLNSQNKNNYTKLNWKELKYRIAFITLTLSSEQNHTDNYIKKYMLNNFLVEAKRLWDVKHYVWRAEKQLNGNIHFHILVDKFIPWQELRAIWNRIQGNHGYIEKYRYNMKEYHKNGFKINTQLLNKWSVTNQLKAYKIGQKTNWSNPNSTDIHSIKLINNVGSYVTKYMTKGSKINHIKVKASDINYIKPLFKEFPKLSNNTLKFLRNVANTGRLWSCSVELTYLKGGGCVVDSHISNELSRLSKDNRVKCFDESYFKIISFNIQVLIDNHCLTLLQLLSEYICDHFIFLDKVETPLFKIPQPAF